MSFPDGIYFVGDLSNVLQDRWSEVIAAATVSSQLVGGTYQLADGTKFAIYPAADGLHVDQYNREYAVESGNIGCVCIDFLTNPSLSGTIHFKESFEVTETDGVLRFGDVVIDSN